MKLAICIRGGLRSWDKCKGNILSSFIFDPSVQVDWFFDTWDNGQYTTNFYDSSCKFMMSSVGFEKIDTDRINAIKQDFTDRGQHLVSVNVHDMCHKLAPAKSFARLVLLSNMSKRKHESITGDRYDMVLQIRPDIVWSQEATERVINGIMQGYMATSTINYDANSPIMTSGYYLNSHAKDWLGNPYEVLPTADDRVFYSTNNAIDALSALYSHYDGLFAGAQAPHVNYANHCMRYGIFLLPINEAIFHIRSINIDSIFKYDEVDDDYFNVLGLEQINVLIAIHEAWYTGHGV